MFHFLRNFQSNGRLARILKFYGLIYLGLILILGSFVLGWELGSKRNISDRAGQIVGEKEKAPAYLSRDINFSLYWDVLEAIKNKYIGQPINEVKLFYGSIAGLVASLEDPYSIFLEPQISQEFKQELSGEFSGIGAEVGMKNGNLTIIAPLEDSPAERAGLKSGDIVISISGESTSGMALDVAVSKIRGRAGTDVTLTIERPALEEQKDFTIRRNRIIIKTVRVEFFMNDTIARLKVSQFNEDTLGDFAKAVNSVITRGAKKIILDLRNNPGGFLDSAVGVSGEWLGEEVAVVERFADGAERTYQASGRARLASFPTIVLVNGGSASGSEIVAGALQDYSKARVLGEKTFGKGSVQDFSSFSDGSSLKLTIAEWLTPKKRSINKVGITPDIEVKMEEKDFEAGRDPQLEKAVELLR